MTTTAKTKTRRVGPKMRWALDILAARGGTMQGKWNLARSVGPHGSNSYGDRVVMRCVDAGLIKLSGDAWGPRGYTLTLTDAGRAALKED
jgi:hypothetical protein